MNTIIVKVNNKVETIAEHTVVLKNETPTVIKAVNRTNYELLDTTVNRAPNNVITKRVDNNLHISFENDGQGPDIIIEGFYDSADSALIGIAEDGNYYYYLPDTGEVTDYVTELQIGEAKSQSLGGDSQISPWWVGATEAEGFTALPWLLGLAGVGVAAAALGGGSDNNDSVQVDTTAPAAPTIDTPIAGDNAVNGDEAEEGFAITGTGEPGATITLTDGSGNVIGTGVVKPDGTWSVAVDEAAIAAMGEGPETITATATDLSGNVSTPTTADITIDTMAPDTPTITIGDGDDTINGFDLADNGQVTVTVGLQAGTSVGDLISVNGGAGVAVTADMLANGYVITVPAPAEGEGLSVTATVTDQAGNSSGPGEVTATVGDITAPVIDAVDDLDSLDLELQTDISMPINRTETTIVEALGGSNGSNSNLNFTVSDNTNGTVNIEVTESAVVQVADAISLEIYDSNDNLLYVAANGNNPLVGNVLGLEILGLTNNNGGLTATLSGLEPGDYKVVVSKDSGTLENLINDLSVAELGEAGVVLGSDNQTAILDAVEDSLNGGLTFGLGTVVRGTLELALNLTTDIGVGDFLAIARPILITAGASVDPLLDAVAAEVLSNTLALLKTTKVTATLTEYSFDNNTVVSGNVIDPDPNSIGEVGEDIVTANTVLTNIIGANGIATSTQLDGVNALSINGEYGVLIIDEYGKYEYRANGDYASSGQSDTFTYTIFDNVTGDNDTADLVIDLGFTVDMAAGDDIVNITNNVLQSSLDTLDDNANTINIDSALNVNIIGGEGFDTINLTGSGQTLSLSDIFQTEVLDIGGAGANTLLVQAADIANSGTSNPIYVRGDSDDTVDLGSNGTDFSDVGGTWTNVGAAPDTGYDVWQLGNDISKQIYIDTDITVI